MAGDRSSKGKAAAGGDGYELDYFASKHRITHAQAREIIRKVGNNRAKLDAAASKLRTGALTRRKDRGSQ